MQIPIYFLFTIALKEFSFSSFFGASAAFVRLKLNEYSILTKTLYFAPRNYNILRLTAAPKPFFTRDYQCEYLSVANIELKITRMTESSSVAKIDHFLFPKLHSCSGFHFITSAKLYATEMSKYNIQKCPGFPGHFYQLQLTAISPSLTLICALVKLWL